MKVSFGSISVEYNPNIDNNGRVFNEIKEAFPKGAKIETDHLKDFNDTICWTNHRIEGKNLKQEEGIAVALIKAGFHFSILNDNNTLNPSKRIKDANEFLASFFKKGQNKSIKTGKKE